MRQDGAGAFKRRLEQRHPYLFVEHWKEGERPFNWFAEWNTYLSKFRTFTCR